MDTFAASKGSNWNYTTIIGVPLYGGEFWKIDFDKFLFEELWKYLILVEATC